MRSSLASLPLAEPSVFKRELVAPGQGPVLAKRQQKSHLEGGLRNWGGVDLSAGNDRQERDQRRQRRNDHSKATQHGTSVGDVAEKVVNGFRHAIRLHDFYSNLSNKIEKQWCCQECMTRF